MASQTVGICENCEAPFCLTCDEAAGKCIQCGHDYCGDCRRQGETCFCSSDEDES